MAVAIPLQLLPAPPLDRLARPLRDLRISVIDACNFRCPYCMPADAAPAPLPRLGFAQIERLARAFVALGVGKLRLTGGEPLLRRDLPLLVRRLAAEGETVAYGGWRFEVVDMDGKRIDKVLARHLGGDERA